MLSPRVPIVTHHACDHQPRNNCSIQRHACCATMLAGSALQKWQAGVVSPLISISTAYWVWERPNVASDLQAA